MQATATWQDLLKEEKNKPYFKEILATVKDAREQGITIYPEADDVFNAFKFTPLEDLKVVIIGQDPYHGPNQAHGLAFSVKPGIKPPPSLMNIFKELKQDLNIKPAENGCLERWARQGVLLLNATLTVEAHKAHSHASIGWQTFTDAVISQINAHSKGVVFLLWGAFAIRKGKWIDRNRHHVLTSTHPSPLSAHRGFLGCQHFSQTNALLKKMGKKPITW